MSDTTHYRDLGLLETYFVSRNEIGFYSPVVVWTEYEAPINRTVLISGVVKLLEKWSHLSACVFRHLKPMQFRLLTTIDLHNLIEFEDGQGSFVETYLPSLHKHTFDYDEKVPLWKITVYQSKIIALTFDHALLDGTAAAIFQVDLNKAMQDVVPDTEIPTFFYGNSGTNKGFAIDQMRKLTPPFTVAVAAFAKEFFPSFLKPKSNIERTTSLYPPIAHPATNVQYRQRVLSTSDMAKLISMCHQHASTFTFFLHTILCVAVANTLVLSKDLICDVPVNARRFLPGPGYEKLAKPRYGNYVCRYRVISKRLEKFDWAEAMSQTETAKLKLAPDLLYSIGILWYLFGKYTDYIKSQVGKPDRDSDMEISNLGAHYFTGYGKVVNMGFSQPQATNNAPFELNVAGVKGECTTIMTRWSDSVTGEGIGNRFWVELNLLLDGILDITSSPAQSPPL
ncbi:alcohol acetyltransferase [Lipomyces oligophaga]|uniref:alcohol acetyltransferase n=1 Tax=Lipomyces oligophaga TaxID=45792 RepID=UPI0034CF9696